MNLHVETYTVRSITYTVRSQGHFSVTLNETLRMPAKQSPQRQPLSRIAIVSAAIDLADLDGVQGLSMRNLARRLGFEVMALYNHIANKNELLSLMVDNVAEQIEEPSGVEPLQAIRANAMSTRAVLVKHPWAAELWLKHLPGPARVAQMEFLLRAFDESGLSKDLAHHGFHAITNHVHGYTLQEQSMTLGSDPEEAEDTMHSFIASLSPNDHSRTIAHVHQHLDGSTSSSFELVLDLILDGLVRLDGQ